MRRATVLLVKILVKSHNFYPRSPCGERRVMAATITPTYEFLSTLSLRRATENANNGSNANLNFYPRSPCGERPYRFRHWPIPRHISIHALLAESDARRASRQQPAGISIHALLAESDGISSTLIIGFSGFLSTLSLRRATRCHCLPGQCG